MFESSALRTSEEYVYDYTRNFTFTRHDPVTGNCNPTSLEELRGIIVNNSAFVNETSVQELQCAGYDLDSLKELYNDRDVIAVCLKEEISFCSCCNIHQLTSGVVSGIYTIRNASVYCDNSWLIMLHYNINHSINFQQPLKQYRIGFGDLNGSHWLGLDFLHEFTEAYHTELQIELSNGATATKIIVSYDKFYIESYNNQYKLRVESYHGDIPDYFSLHNGYGFSTYDRDLTEFSCTLYFGGVGWWYHGCWHVFFTGHHIYWNNSIFTEVIMKIRPKVCPQSCN